MASAVSSADVARREIVVDPNTYFIGDFFGALSGGRGPQGFLVEFPTARGTIRPHFHRVDQFQVVVDGGGSLGKHPVGPIACHYTDGFTPYGPIVTEGEGISFYTLRAAADTGAYYMPGSRDKLERRAGRGLSWEAPGAGHAAPATGHAAPATDTDALTAHFAPHADGLAAYTLRLGPGATLAGLSPEGGAGQYHVVIAGSLRWEGRDLPPRSLVWVDPDEVPPAITAGPEGLIGLILQFPRGRDR